MASLPALSQRLAPLCRRLPAVAHGADLVLAIDGLPGTGRSHAIAQLAAAAERAGVRVAQVRADPHEGELKFGLIGALADALGEKITPRALQTSEEIADVASQLLEAASRGDDRAGSCLLVDDAEWADEASLRVVLHVARRVRQHGVALIVAGGRGGSAQATAALLDELHALPGVDLVQLGPLDCDEAADVVRTAAPALDAAAHQLLLERTGGNAFLLSALLGELVGSGRLDVDAIVTTVPERVRAAVSARLNRLGPDAWALAHAVHVFEADATLTRVTALAALDRRAAEDAADALVRLGVLRPDLPLAFAQPLVGAAVGRTLEPFALDRLHRKAAALLAAEGGPAIRAAHHLVLTGPQGEVWAVDQLRGAAEDAGRDGDYAAAVAFLRRALAEGPADEVRRETLSSLAFAESRAGLPEAAATIDDALTLVTAPESRLMLLRERTRLMWLTGRLPEAVEASEQALVEAEPGTGLHDKLLAELLAVASMHDLAPIYARPRLVGLLERAGTGWVPDSAALAATLATVLPFVLGDHRLVGPLVDRATAEDLWRVDAPPFGMRPDFVIGSLWLSGGLARGTRIIEQGRAAVDPENLFRHGLLHYWLGEIRYAAGDLAGAIEAATTALSPKWGPYLSWSGFSSATLAHAHLDLDDPIRAARVLDEVEGSLDPHQLYGIAVDLARARLLVTTGHAYDAAPLLESVAERLDRLGHRDGPQIVWRPIAAVAALELGDPDAARDVTDEEIRLGRATAAANRLGRALRIRARVADGAERIDLLRESAEVLSSSEYRLEHARTLLALGIELHCEGATAAARAVLAESRELSEACGALPLANQALNALHATGARPRRTARSGVDSLTASERRIVELASRGHTNRDIAEVLNIAPRTVEWHLRGAFEKLGVQSRRDLAAVLERRG